MAVVSTFGRYVFRQVFLIFFACLATLTGIVWVSQAIRRLDLLTDLGQTAFLFFKITLLILPWLVAVISPVAVMVACSYVLYRMNTDSELVIISAAGGSRWPILRPLLMFAGIVTLMMLAANTYLAPLSVKQFEKLMAEVRADVLAAVLKPGEFQTLSKGLTVHLRERTKDGTLKGVMIEDTRDKRQVTTQFAKTGVIVRNETGVFLVMDDGQIHRKPRKGDDIRVVVFDRYVFDLSTLTNRKIRVHDTPRSRFIWELLFPKPNDWFVKHQPGRLVSEAHERLAGSLYPIVFVLLTVLTLGRAQTTRQSRMGAVISGALAGIIVRGLGLISTNLTVKNPAMFPLIYFFPIAAALIAATAIAVRIPIRFSLPLPAFMQGRQVTADQ